MIGSLDGEGGRNGFVECDPLLRNNRRKIMDNRTARKKNSCWRLRRDMTGW